MEEEGVCEECGASAVVIDYQTGEAGCQECGRTADASNLCHQTGSFQNGEWREFGEFVSEERAGLEEGKGLRSEKCSQKLVDDLRGFASVLRLSQKVLNEGEGLLNDTKEYYSSGAIERNLYLGVLLYVMIRRCAVPITLYEIASCVGRNYRDLSRKYRRLVKACSLRVPAHNLSIYLDRFADDLIDFMESKKMFKCPNSRDVSRATRQDDKQLKKTEPTIKDPTKQEFLELVHDLKEFVLQRTSVQGCKPVVFAGGVLSLCVESRYSKTKADFVFSEFFKASGVVVSCVKPFKLMVKRFLLSMAHQLPGFVNLTSLKLKSRLPAVLKSWKSVIEIEDTIANTVIEGECQEGQLETEAVGATPLTELLQEAGLIGDLSKPKANRGFCPPENYKVTVPCQMARFLVPHVLHEDGVSSGDDSEGEFPGNDETVVKKGAKDGSAKRPIKRKNMCLDSFLVRVPVPGRKSAFTHSINTGQHGPSDVRSHPKSRSRMVKALSERTKRQKSQASSSLARSESVAQELPHKNIAGIDEFRKEGLSDIDEEEIEQYILNPREAALKALLSSCSQHE